MALYMYEAAYTPESVAAQIKEPHDRLEAVKPALEAMGIKIMVGNPLGEYDVLIIIEAADDATWRASTLPSPPEVRSSPPIPLGRRAARSGLRP